MGNRHFFDRPQGLTVADITALTGAESAQAAPASLVIRSVAPVDLAGPSDLTFVDGNRFADALTKTRAGACLMPKRFADRAPEGLVVLYTEQPYRAFVAVHRKLFPQSLSPASLFETDGIFEGATVHPTAKLESDVTIDPGAVIGPRAEIGSGTLIAANAVIGPDVTIGRDCRIGTGCSITHTLIGDRVTVHPGCRIGQDGFGYTEDAAQQKIPQTGRVIIQNDVEIGAGTTIDRGGIRDTVVGEASKIDNLCQIGHNCQIGRYCIIVAQCGLSGSVTLEDFAVLGGSVGLAPHVTIGRGGRVAARSGVMHNVPPGETWGGYPARPRMQWMRQETALARLAGGGSNGKTTGKGSIEKD
ncbi:UDP-3-O-(3-hydroxymyristoyl)glucosamine N-acyltransferase [Bradyrhizobium sp.]|uniref:UDP-3-O-(3-hydroxymyristoyl)glucosamine N-acyltransferase n=1 Tax=Bradyrhizobium sp. TaxID=376 RepID=UPI00261F7DCF|nr:UDP-3-O-(3-hydroxymyristoyl)glucosamine N-acyltransferase [Bradyrhizobium sp.]